MGFRRDLVASAARCGAALALASITVPAAAQRGNPYDTERPEFAELAALEDRAVGLMSRPQKDAEVRTQIIVAWRALQDAASTTLVDGGAPHPLKHAAGISAASQLYTLGENAQARAELETAIEGLRPYRAYYPAKWAEGLALLGVLMTQDGDADAAWEFVREGYEQYLAIGPVEITPGSLNGPAMAKSNLEFALAEIASRTGRAAESLVYQKASLDTREAALGPTDPDTIASYYGYAGALRRAGRMDEAEKMARIAVERAVAHIEPSHPTYARSLEMLGIVLSRSGRPVEATDYLIRALELKRVHEGPDNLIFAYGIHNLGTILLQRENYAAAAPLFVEAEALFREKQGEGSPYAVGSLAHAAQIDFVEGRPEEAVGRFQALEARLGEDSTDIDMRRRIAPEYVRALIATGATDRALAVATSFRASLLESDQPDALLLRIANTLIARSKAAKDPDATDEAVAQANAIVELLSRRGAARMYGSSSAEIRGALDLAMEIAAIAGDADLMLSAIQLLDASEISAATLRRDARRQEADPRLADAIRALQDANDAVERADGAVLAALLKGRQTEEARAAHAEAMARHESARSHLAADFPAWSSTDADRRDPGLDDLRASLAEGEAILAVMPAYAGTYQLVVDRDGALASATAGGRAGILSLARDLRGDAVTGNGLDRTARALSRAIFSRSVRDRLSDKSSLRIIAGGALASLPFSLLDWPEERGATQQKLVDRFAISNRSGFQAVRRAEPKDRRLARFVGFADPAPFGGATTPQPAEPTRGISSYFDRDGPDKSVLARLPRLEATLAEVRDVARFFAPASSTILVGAEASEEALAQASVREADVILFATHGLVAGEIEGVAEPALVLAAPAGEGGEDGVLTASEVAELDLAAEWVILSACDSAAGMRGGQPAFSGLAQAFRSAGAGALLVTHWQGRDDVAAFVSRETLRNWREHGDKARALREALIALRTDSALPGADEPSVWGPFALIED